MSYHPRIKSKDYTSFTTSRCRNSELWFANNQKLEARILAYLAKYVTIYEVILYGFAIEGNHLQTAADFPKGNRAEFKRVFNSVIAKLVPRYCKLSISTLNCLIMFKEISRQHLVHWEGSSRMWTEKKSKHSTSSPHLLSS